MRCCRSGGVARHVEAGGVGAGTGHCGAEERGVKVGGGGWDGGRMGGMDQGEEDRRWRGGMQRVVRWVGRCGWRTE